MALQLTPEAIVVPAQAGLFPPSPSRRWAGTCRPRAGGAVPRLRLEGIIRVGSSPRRRGCSRRAARPVPGGERRPRAGGAVPVRRIAGWLLFESSPRRRGCSERADMDDPEQHVVPAQAGLFRSSRPPGCPGPRRPRAGGAVPGIECPPTTTCTSSPRRRGCSAGGRCLMPVRSVVPAQAGLFPFRDGWVISGTTSSPRRRGCSLGLYQIDALLNVVPAQAGLFRCRPLAHRRRRRRPRAGGAVPVQPPSRVKCE